MKSDIRNFSIIAHIDHGKSTLADRILEFTGAISERERVDQILDDMPLERERGITIKSRSVAIRYHSQDNNDYLLNLIDTPGHVDFHYEVSRSLAACEGALLVVDAGQGVQAQTVANVYAALKSNLEVIPVINKIDLPQADPERVCREIEEIIGLDTKDAVFVSAKTGQGIPELLRRIIDKIPPPQGDESGPLRALVFDSWFDSYLGVMVQVRVVDGTIRRGSEVRFLCSGAAYEVTEMGVFTPFRKKLDSLKVGEVGFISGQIKNLRDAKIGDTVIDPARPTTVALPGFAEIRPMVFSGLFPTDAEEYESLRDALNKLQLNDASFSFQPETSTALGFGFRCGYLGLLHMEIIQERLEREYGVSLITTAPSVEYRIVLNTGKEISVDNPAKFPNVGEIARILEPVVRGTIHVSQEFLGGVLSLCEDKRGTQEALEFFSGNRVRIVYKLPLNEIVLDFYDRLKSASRGYASFDYELAGYEESDLVKLDIKVNGEIVDALSTIIHRSSSFYRGQRLTEKMKDLIDRQMFEIAVQASIGNRVIARSTVKAMRKNVTAKCYGGDITRKRKLLEKQKEGKKRMKQVGSVSISQDAFLAILKLDQ